MKKIGMILMLGAMLTLAACGAKNNDMMNQGNMNDGANTSTEMSGTSGNDEMMNSETGQDMMGDEMKDGEMGQDMMGDEMKDGEMGK
ncbi:MAG: hypothetical protein E6Y08_14805 [Paenibacillus sp.]|uniref:hypothetical protein n=1 Tax=Paenibacillus sp. TaxID=58172 RepID=UPI002907BC29|nr:hypothetical protein [Paenibacillus sp.]MDU4697081.1 hypothetical protein [Paenibacillus sp.]